jgi:hypothetical protein
MKTLIRNKRPSKMDPVSRASHTQDERKKRRATPETTARGRGPRAATTKAERKTIDRRLS